MSRWRTPTFLSSYAPKYHGLFNQGATCYLNSVLQVLFMTKDFREAVKRYTDENPDTMDRHLHTLFSDLQKDSAYTFNITRALGIDRVHEQRDAAEYIEKILQQTSDGASQIFHGRMSHRTKCCQCGAETDSDEAFWHLPLDLVDSNSVVDGIEDFFRASEFSGEDQMYCDTCDDKADATAQYVMKHHPDVLILLLKRFQFSDRYRSYDKIRRVVDVPSTIQIPERQTYKLYAVVDHFGDLRGGHYTATIKDEDEDRWYNFNDSRVTLCGYQPFQVDNTESSARSQTAQLLFYRKMEEAVNQDNMSTDHNQCENAEMTRQRDEGEGDVETGDKESEKLPMDYLNRDAEHLSEGGSDKLNRKEYLTCNLKTGQQFDSECKQGRRSRSDTNPEQQSKERRREVVGSNKQKRTDQEHVRKDKKYDGSENPDNASNARPNIRKNTSGELVAAPFHNREVSGQEGTVRGERENQGKGREQRIFYKDRKINQV